MPNITIQWYAGRTERLATQREGAPVHGDEQAAVQIVEELHRLFGVDVVRVARAESAVAADRQRRDVEGPEPPADLGQGARVARVAAEEQALAAAGNHPRGPESLVLVEQPAPRAMLGRRGRE